MKVLIVTHIIVSTAHPKGPDVGVPRVLEFREDSILVLLDWTIVQTQRYKKDTLFSINATPEVIIMSINSMSAQLQISYNIQYNVRITATLCELANATAMITLHFGESFQIDA